MQRNRFLWATALCVALLAGCFEPGEDELDGGVPDAVAPCTDGEEQPCLVADGCLGTQVCADGVFGACAAPAEVCDGVDNNCDGTIDEGYEQLGDPCTAGEGKCLARGRYVCAEDGADVVCDAVAGDQTDEVCDGVDNDCNGEVDDGVEVGVECDTGRLGVCSVGSTTCEEGDTRCNPVNEATDEVCDGLDNDCDGRTDEDGAGGVLAEPCYDGPEGTEGVGQCAPGARLCVDGMFGACADQVLPGEEICDGVDNDCDGEVDGEQCACVPGEVQGCYSGPDGTQDVGACAGGVQTCLPDGSGFGPCEGEVVPGVELCDGRDNDCDGDVDDAPGVGGPCAVGDGFCGAAGTLVCDLETGQVVCDAEPGLPEEEICDGLDNDCDGMVDDLPGIGEPCEVGTGACLARGVQVCAKGDVGPLICSAIAGEPSDEVCDGIDNDCDGVVDDVEGLGDACAVGIGACRSTGVTVCSPEGVVCGATEQPAAPAEYCGNRADDDCDGETDEPDCVIPCDVDEDCGPGALCEDGACRPGDCRGDEDCAPGEELCVDDFCAPGDCREDADCAEGELCDGNFCIEPPIVCDGPPVIDAFGSVEGSTVEAPSQATASCGDGARSPENAYELALGFAGTVCIDTFGSNYDTVLYARGDCIRAGTEIACSDDVGPAGFRQSQLELELAADQTVYVFVDGFGADNSGDYVLTVREGPCGACADDRDCPGSERCAPTGPDAGVCVPESCGDGIRDGGEQCDDGRTDDGDGCSARCRIEDGFDCIEAPAEIAPVPVEVDGRVNCGPTPANATPVDVPAWPAYRLYYGGGFIQISNDGRKTFGISIAVDGEVVATTPNLGVSVDPAVVAELYAGFSSDLFGVGEGQAVGAFFRDNPCADNGGVLNGEVRAVDFCFPTTCLADEDCLFGTVCVDGECVEPLDSDGDGVADLRDVDDDNDGIPDAAECFGGTEGQASVINGGFEEPAIAAGGNRQTPEADVPGWETTEGPGQIEMWGSGFLGVPAAVGNAFAEINASEADGALYQDVVTVPGTVFTWSFYHRGREGEDELELRAGPPDATETLTNAVTGNEAWRRYTGTYVVPEGQVLTRFEFRSVRSTGGASLGNFVDGVEFLPACPADADADGDGVPNSLDLDSDGDGILDADEAGHGLPHTDGRVDGPVGGNGLVDEAETVPDSGIIDYEIADRDGDGVYDFLQDGPYSCGNGVIDEGEECDDGDRDAGDGCGPDCAVEPDWACVYDEGSVGPCGEGDVVDTLTLEPGNTLEPIGGQGGGPFSDPCQPGEILLGFDYHVGNQWVFGGGRVYLQRSRAQCGRLELIDGEPVITPTGVTPDRGGGAGSGVPAGYNTSVRCPEGQVVRGFTGYGDQYASGVALACSTIGVVDGQIVLGEPVVQDPVGRTDNDLGTRLCPEGTIVGGNVGRSGHIIDQFTMRCDVVVSACRQEAGSICEFNGECLVDDDCEGGDLCRGNRCVSTGMCPDDDELEPNDSRDTATPVVDGRYEGLAVCGNDDWYTTALCAGGTLTIDLYFIDADGDVDLQVPGGPSSASTSDDERVVVVNAGPERDVDWRVYGFSGAQNGYVMDVTVDCDDLVPWCGDGVVNGDEECDDGNRESDDGCSADCVPDVDLRCERDADCADGEVCTDGRCTVVPDSDGDGVTDVRDLDDDNDGILDTEECTPGLAPVRNSSFEAPVIADGAFLYIEPPAQGGVFGWTTNVDGTPVEIQARGHATAPEAALGRQYAEANAAVVGGFYQDVATEPGRTYEWTMYHRGRDGVDTLEIRFGAPGPVAGLDPVRRVTSGNAEWTLVSGTYVVPAGQEVTRLSFEAIASAGGASRGNFIDGFTFTPVCDLDTDGDGIVNSLDLDSDGDGLLDADEAGHGAPHTDGVVDGPTGGNGVPDIVETVPDSSDVDYVLADLDANGIPDFLHEGPSNCGDGVLDEGEGCDDGNRDPGDGCDADCAVEPDWACEDPGVGPCPDGAEVETVTVEPGDLLPAIGGEGGQPFDDPCGPGEVMIGFDLAVGPWVAFPGIDFITRSQGACARFDVVDGEVVLTPTGLTPLRGETGQINNQTRCPADHVVTGYVGYDAGAAQRYVAGIQLVCSPVAVVDGRIVVGEPVLAEPVGNVSNRVGRFDCGPGQLVGGNVGRSGAIIDRFTMRCDNIVEACRNASLCEYQGECVVDGDCDAGQLCRGNVCIGTGACPDDDGFEPNDDMASAAPVMDGRYEGLAVCGNDDWYTIDLCAGGTLTIDLYFVDDDGDIDLSVPGGPSSASTSDDERVVVVDDGAGRRVDWRVYGFSGAQNTYAMDVAVTGCAALCPDGGAPAECPEGFAAVDDRTCELQETVPAVLNGEPLDVCRAPVNAAYGTAGARLPGGGAIVDAFFTTDATSRLNTVGIWACGPNGQAGDAPLNEPIGFARCVVIDEPGAYVVGIAGDNGVRAAVDGEVIFDQQGDNVATFNNWYLLPIELTAGTHIITLEGSNLAGPAAFGAELYGPFPAGSTADDEAMRGLPYADSIVFSTLDEVGGLFETGETSGYSCDAGFALDLCGGGEPMCTRFERLDRCAPIDAEICDNGVDDDGDGDVDCADRDCNLDPACAINRTVYFSAPTLAGELPVAPTRLYTVDGAGQIQLLGNILLDGLPIVVSALALSPDGMLWGFEYRAVPVGTRPILIDPDTATAEVMGDYVDVYIDGAAFDPDGNLWVTDETNNQVRGFDGDGIGPPVLDYPVDFLGSDIAFDADGDCYITGVGPDFTQFPLYACDLVAGEVFELGIPVSGPPFDTVSGETTIPAMAFAYDEATCEQRFYAFDSRSFDELGYIDLGPTPPTMNHIASTGINFSYYTTPDMAGFPSAANSPGCQGGGAEICDNGIDDDGNGERDCGDAACVDDPFCAIGADCAVDADCDPGQICDTGACVNVAFGTCNQPTPIGFEQLRGTTTGAPAVNDTATCAFNSPDLATGPEFVYVFTAQQAGEVCVSTLGSQYDTMLYVHRDTCGLPENEVACNDDIDIENNVLTSRLTLPVEPGVDYYIFLDGWQGGNGGFVLDVLPGGCGIQPPEACADGIDNDGNNAIDCDDFACAEDPACQIAP